jgi:hypothetical protein
MTARIYLQSGSGQRGDTVLPIEITDNTSGQEVASTIKHPVSVEATRRGAYLYLIDQVKDTFQQRQNPYLIHATLRKPNISNFTTMNFLLSLTHFFIPNLSLSEGRTHDGGLK